MNTIENEFFNIIKLETRLTSDSDLLVLSKKKYFDGSFEMSDSMLNLEKKLSQIKDVSQYVENAFVFIPSLNMKINYDSITAIDNAEYDDYLHLLNKKSYPFTYDNQNIYILIPSFFISPKTDELVKPPYVICVIISDNKLKTALDDSFKYNQCRAILIGDKYGLSINPFQDEDLSYKLKSYINKEDVVEHQTRTEVVKIDGKNYIISFRKSMTLNTTLVVYQPEEQLSNVINRNRIWIGIVSILTVILIILFSIWLRRMIVQPLERLVNAFDSLDDGVINISVSYNSNDEFGYIYKKFNNMCRKLSTLIKEVYEEKLHSQNAELKQLQYQINPHFLYNCFFLIYRLAKMHDEANVVKLTQHLGSYYQFVTRSSGDEVPLIKEVNHVRDYIEIQTMRFYNRIKVEMEELPDELKDIYVPKLILQPIVENSYNHGLKDRLTDGYIKIGFVKVGTLLKINIEDNGSSIDEEKIEELRQKLESEDLNIENTGLINVHKRLRLKYGKTAGIEVYSIKPQGLKVEISIETERNENNV